MNRYLHNVPCVFLSVRTSSLMPLDLKIFHYGGVFVCASMNESEVQVSECVHSDYRLWYSASSLTLVYVPITTAERKSKAKAAAKS